MIYTHIFSKGSSSSLSRAFFPWGAETRKIITEDQMKQFMNDYYRARGWNEKGEPPKSERHKGAWILKNSRFLLMPMHLSTGRL